MQLSEALSWLRGERSLTNIVPQDPRETWLVRIARADAAATEQAYWIARAHHEGVVPPEAIKPPLGTRDEQAELTDAFDGGRTDGE